MMNEKLFFLVGKSVFSTILRYKVDSNAADTAEGFADIFQEVFGNYTDAIKAFNNVQSIQISASTVCKKVLNDIDLPDDRKEALLDNLKTAFESLAPDCNTIFNTKGDYSILASELLKANPRYKDNLNPIEYVYYKRLLQYLAHFTINAFKILPDFNGNGVLLLNAKMDQMQRNMDRLLSEVAAISHNTTSSFGDFETNYKMALINKLRFIHVYGLGTRIRDYAYYDLHTSFIKLDFDFDEAVADRKGSIDTDWFINKRNYYKNIWISGPAGSGKTTYLQWLAISMANDDVQLLGRKNLIPIFINVRSLKEYSLRKCIENVMSNTGGSIPNGWIEKCHREARFVFLFDGFDEVKRDVRNDVFNWVRELDPGNRCIKIFTARPHIKEEDQGKLKRIKNLIFLHVCSMSLPQIREFITKWHAAVIVKELDSSTETAKALSSQLYNRILLSDSLRKLSSTPLLCTMICSLNHVNNGNIPSSKMELYRECVYTLVEKRDRERDIYYENISLSQEDKVLILSRLSYWMMLNDYFTQVNCEEVLSQIDIYKEEMGISDKSETILRYFLNRSGLIRSPEKGYIEFVHRSFLEYLCALRIARDHNWRFASHKITDDNWRETIINAINLANKKDATSIIEYTLDFCKNEDKKAEVDASNKYWFLTFSLLNSAKEVEPHVRNEVQLHLKKIIPPKTNDIAKIAYTVQGLAIPYLHNQGYHSIGRLSCIKTLRCIGGEKCLSAMITYINPEIDIEETRVLSEFFDECELDALIAYNIPNLLIDALSGHIGRVLLNDTVLFLLNFASIEKRKLFCEKVTDIVYEAKIYEEYDYSDEDELMNIQKIPNDIQFINVSTLLINGGENPTLSILNNFPNIETLYICSNISIRYLGKQLDGHLCLQKIIMVFNSTDLIDFHSLGYLHGCSNVELIILNTMDEVLIETLKDFELEGDLTLGFCSFDRHLDKYLTKNDDCFYIPKMKGSLTILTDQVKRNLQSKHKHIHFKGLRNEIKQLTKKGMDLDYFITAYDGVSEIDKILGLEGDDYTSQYAKYRSYDNNGHYFTEPAYYTQTDNVKNLLTFHES